MAQGECWREREEGDEVKTAVEATTLRLLKKDVWKLTKKKKGG